MTQHNNDNSLNFNQVEFKGNSREALRGFPKRARQDAGFALDEVQQGRDPSDFKPMTTIGKEVYELRITIPPKRQYRVVYVAKFDDFVYVLHAFQKTTEQTANHDLETGRKAYRALLDELKAKK